LCLLAGAACWVSLATRAAAADGMEWQFFQADDPGYKTTRLVYGVPETDNVQVSGACVHSSSVGANFSIVTFGADIGDLESGKDTELRVSGGGFDHALKGKIIRATGEEGLNGVEVDIGNDDPLWRAFAEKDSLDYLVPGYKAASLDFARGRDKIQQYVKACETFADVTPPAGPAAAGGGDAEKEAFENAKDLGTVEAWEAFVANYPSGFHADLARAYIKKLGSSETSTAKTAPEPKPAAKKVKKPGCGKGQITVDGKCMSKQKAVGYCGPGYRPQGGKCVQGYVAPKTPPRGDHGCPPGLVWNAQEGCHEDD
jgi:hypothetical protein